MNEDLAGNRIDSYEERAAGEASAGEASSAVAGSRNEPKMAGGRKDGAARPVKIEVRMAPGAKIPAKEPAEGKAEPLTIPARMLNEFVYCPRLFYYEFVEGVFLESADTLRGKAIHARVDAGSGKLPKAKAVNGKTTATGEAPAPDANLKPGKEAADGPPEGGREADAEKPAGDAERLVIHSRSVQMGSERLGVVAKMDLVEARGERPPAESARNAGGTGDLFEALEVCPVDYKAGSPRTGEEGNELWDADRMQLGLQALVLRDNGYRCEEGIIYYRGTKQRVRLTITEELTGWIEEQVKEARRVARGAIPAPLISSPKCVRCSLAPVCLPDETHLLSAPEQAEEEDRKGGVASRTGESSPRRLIAARDDVRALYLNTPGLRIGISSDCLTVKEKEKVLDQVRVRDINHVALFGNIQISTQAVQTLCEHEVPITYFSMGGWFYGITRGHSLKNVFLRRRQFQVAEQAGECVALARRFVNGKVRNHRTMLMRNHVEPPEIALRRLKVLAGNALEAGSIAELLGIEGASASLYFGHFNGMLKPGDGLVEDGAMGAAASRMGFRFENRARRPPTDPVNALLSLAYSILAKDCAIAALAVGFDPYIGFYHQPRFGRPALALDLMEEFRPLIAESAVLNCINNRVVTEDDFVRAGRAVNLTSAGRKKFFQVYEQRVTTVVTHPIFDYKVSYRRGLELQARLLGKYLAGETRDYVPFTTR